MEERTGRGRFRISAACLAVSAGILFAGCGAAALGEEADFESVGVYSVPGYRPAEEDLGAVPYSYRGEGKEFSVVCSIRSLTEEERRFAAEQKMVQISQTAQMKEEYPGRAEEYEDILEKLQRETTAIREAERLYVTELQGTYTGNGEFDAAEPVRYSVSDNGTVCLASAGAISAAPWVSLINAADGSYSEGILLPHRESYEITVQYGDKTDTFTLELDEE